MTNSPDSWLFTVILVIGSTTRLTRLITTDTITGFLRAWSVRVAKDPDHPFPALLRCPWCMGVWIAALVTVWAYFDHGHPYFTYPALALTAAHVAGYAGSKE